MKNFELKKYKIIFKDKSLIQTAHMIEEHLKMEHMLIVSNMKEATSFYVLGDIEQFKKEYRADLNTGVIVADYYEIKDWLNMVPSYD